MNQLETLTVTLTKVLGVINIGTVQVRVADEYDAPAWAISFNGGEELFEVVEIKAQARTLGGTRPVSVFDVYVWEVKPSFNRDVQDDTVQRRLGEAKSFYGAAVMILDEIVRDRLIGVQEDLSNEEVPVG